MDGRQKHFKEQEFLVTAVQRADRVWVNWESVNTREKLKDRVQPVTLGLLQSPGHKPLLLSQTITVRFMPSYKLSIVTFFPLEMASSLSGCIYTHIYLCKLDQRSSEISFEVGRVPSEYHRVGWKIYGEIISWENASPPKTKGVMQGCWLCGLLANVNRVVSQ